MPSEETIEIRKIKSVIGEKKDLPKVNPRVSITSKIKSILLRMAGVPFLSHLYGTFEPNKTLTLDTDENSITSIFSDGTYLYSGLYTTPGKIVKIDLSSFSKVSTLTLDTDEYDVTSLFSDSIYLYAGLDTTPGKIVKIDLSSFSKVSTLTLDTGENFIQTIFSDGTYLYAGLRTAPGKIVKIDLSSFSKVSTLTMDADEYYVQTIFSDGSYLYAGLDSFPGKIVKIDLSSFSKVSTLTLDTDSVYSLDTDGSYLYASLFTYPGKIVKIDLSSFSIVSTLTLSEEESFIWSAFSDGTYLYAGSYTGNIVKIDLSSFSKVSTFTLKPDETHIFSLFSDGTYLYAGLNLSPGKIVRRYIIPMTNLFERKISLIHEQTQTSIHNIYPLSTQSITVTSSSSAWTKGSYVEIIPANTIKTTFYITGVIVNKMKVDTEYEIDIAYGNVSSENVIITVAHETHDTNRPGMIYIDPPTKIPSRSRIASRIATEESTSNTCDIKILYKL